MNSHGWTRFSKTMIEIPEQISPVLGKYRGTGKFTVKDVAEFVRRWKTVHVAKSMDLLQWINHMAFKSEERHLFTQENRRDYLDENIDLWTDLWRYADGNLAIFSRKHLKPFLDEGLLKLVKTKVYDVSSEFPDASRDEWIFDLVKIEI